MALDENHPPNTPMVTITDRNSSFKDLSIFPPVNHEGLHNSVSPDSPFSSSSTSPFSSSTSLSTSISLDSDDAFLPPDCINQSPHKLDARLQISAASRWLRFGLDILRRKIFNYSFPGTFVVAFRSFPLFTTLTALYAGSLLLKWLCLRRNRQYKINLLLTAIKEKDEKIVKLLDQIAQLNQLLLTRHTSH